MNIEIILQRIMEAKKLRTYREVADYLSVKEGTLNAWKMRNRTNALEKILYRCNKELSENYLRTGEGSPFVELISTNELQENEEEQPDDIVIDSRLVPMTIEVLKSGTECGPALASNIIAFHTSIKREKENAVMREEIKELNKKVDLSNQNISQLTEQLKRLIDSNDIVITDKKETKVSNG